VDEIANRRGETPAISEFAVQGTHDASGWTFEVRGDLDLETVPRLRYALADVFAGPAGPVVVDLRAVDFFDVTALNLFAETARRLHRRGGRFYLRGLSPFQHRLLLTCGLTRLGTGSWTERVSVN
jgi:anti-anti-sigma factor